MDFLPTNPALKPCQLEELSYHAGTFSHVALDQFGTNDANEASICALEKNNMERGVKSCMIPVGGLFVADFQG